MLCLLAKNKLWCWPKIRSPTEWVEASLLVIRSQFSWCPFNIKIDGNSPISGKFSLIICNFFCFIVLVYFGGKFSNAQIESPLSSIVIFFSIFFLNSLFVSLYFSCFYLVFSSLWCLLPQVLIINLHFWNNLILPISFLSSASSWFTFYLLHLWSKQHTFVVWCFRTVFASVLF